MKLVFRELSLSLANAGVELIGLTDLLGGGAIAKTL